jgi:hypothetical protein
MTKKIIATILTLGFFLTVYAESFVVTSYADSGPGTLREAIEKANANGIAGQDFIYFQIPDLAFNTRIINLVTELPSLSSNIIIDGSTQGGSSYGTTESKICLKKMIMLQNSQC